MAEGKHMDRRVGDRRKSPTSDGEMTPMRVIQIRRWELAIAFLALAASYIIGILLLHREYHNRCVNVEDIKAIQYDRLGRQIKRTEEALKDHPGPFVFGIPRNLIVQGLQDDMATRLQYKPINCP